MTTSVDVLADLRILANIGEYRDLRESMEKCLRPHERAGFADLLARMGDNHTAVAELIDVASAVSTSCASNYGDATGLHLDLAASGGLNERLAIALARVKGA